MITKEVLLVADYTTIQGITVGHHIAIQAFVAGVVLHRVTRVVHTWQVEGETEEEVREKCLALKDEKVFQPILKEVGIPAGAVQGDIVYKVSFVVFEPKAKVPVS